MKKRIFLGFMVLLVMFSLTGCGNKKNVDSGNEGRVKSVDDVNNTGTNEEKRSTSTNTKKNTKPNITEQVILDKNGIKVTAKSISYDGWLGPEIKLLIENNSSENVIIQARNFSVNGIMINEIFSSTVQTGKKANDEITIMNSTLEESNISVIKTIDFSINVSNADSWRTIFKEDGIKLETDAVDYVQEYNDCGTLVFDQNGIKLYILKKVDKDSYLGSNIYVYIENNSSQNITVQVRDVSINGFMIDPIFSSSVSSGKKMYDTITFLDSRLRENNITDINEIELKFHIFNSDSWKTIFDTDVKKISF